MAQYTPNLGLYKPNRNDEEEIDLTLSENFTKIDEVLADTVYLIPDLVENTDITSKLTTVLTNRKGKIKIPKGTYLISGEVTVNSDTHLSGDGMNRTILKIKDNSTPGTVASHGILITENNGNNITIEHLTVDGNQTNQSWTPNGSANYGIAVRSNNTVIQNVECKNVTGNGCGVPVTAKNVVFDKVFSHDNGKKGLHSGEVENIKITNGYYYNNGIDSGIGIHQGMKKGVITNNHCYNNGTYGIHLGDSLGKPSYDFIVADNILYDNAVVNLFIAGKGNDTVSLLDKKAIVTGNILINKGVTISGARNVLLTNNFINNGNIYVQTSFKVDIKQNVIFNPPNTSAGIRVQGAALPDTNFTVGSEINIRNNTIDIGNIGVPYAVEVSGHTNVKIVDNDLLGTPSTNIIRLWDNYATAIIKHEKGIVRIESDFYNDGFNNYNLVTVCTTALRPKKARKGEQAFDTTLGKPIWCKTASVLDVNGAVTTAAVWVDATGATV